MNPSNKFTIPKPPAPEPPAPTLKLAFRTIAYEKKSEDLSDTIATKDFLAVASFYSQAMELNANKKLSTDEWDLLFVELIEHIACAGEHIAPPTPSNGATTTPGPPMWKPTYNHGVVFLLQIRKQWRLDLIWLATHCTSLDKKQHLQIAADLYTCPFVDDPTQVLQRAARQACRDVLVQRYHSAYVKQTTVVNHYHGPGTPGSHRARGKKGNPSAPKDNNNHNSNASNPPSTPVGHRTRSRDGDRKQQGQ
jgi:hypothetical protein